jgi:HSP20 family protein
MNHITRWDPFKELEDLRHRLSGAFGRPTTSSGGSQRESMTVAEWAPLVDITEDDKEYLIKAEIPEVRKEDVKVTVENGVLSISGERKFEKEENGRRYHRVERSYGSFVRTFSVPEDADASKVNAEFKEGVLKVHLIKSERTRPRQIEVQVS